jgi:hypothetical protein
MLSLRSLIFHGLAECRSHHIMSTDACSVSSSVNELMIPSVSADLDSSVAGGPFYFFSMTEELWFRGQCPKCFKKIRASQPGHEDCLKKMLWHLQSSEKHPMTEEEALEIMEEKPDAIWEDEQGTAEEKEEEEKQKTTLRSRSRSRGKSGAKDRGHHDRGSSHGGHQSRNWQKGGGGKGQLQVQRQGKSSSSLSWRDQQIVEVTTERVISNVVTEQQEKVFQFAKTLGKCQAVIQTAARVARQCVSAFEDGVHT